MAAKQCQECSAVSAPGTFIRSVRLQNPQILNPNPLMLRQRLTLCFAAVLPLLFLQNSKYLLTFSLPKLYDNGKKEKESLMTWPYLKQYLKFLFVLSCAVSVWVRFFRHRGSLKSVSPFLPAALSFAVAADYCFLFSGNYTAAVAFFCGVQSCYCLVRRASLPRFWLMGAAGTLAFFLGFSLLGVSLDLQSLTAFFYLSCLAVNLVSVIRQKNFWFTVCLLLLLAGDLHVAVYNLHWYLPVGQYHWYQVWWELSTPLIWGFYLPGQLLQAAKMPEICGLRHA